MAYADGQLIEDDQIALLSGVRWYPRKGVLHDEGLLRTPMFDEKTKIDSLSDLKRAHQSALNRIEHDKPLNTVEKPKVFDRVFYESKERMLRRSYVVFDLRQDDGSFFAYPQDKLIHIAGMVRHLAITAMENAPPEGVDTDWVNRYVAGHACDDAETHRQFSYLPLPSIGHQHADQKVRRVMIAAPSGDDRLLQHLAKRLNGQQLKPTSQTKLDHPPKA